MSAPEAAARVTIDLQLKGAGWTIAPANARLQILPSTPLALCEESGDTGRADYVLYLDGKACGILEAKRADHSLEGVQEQSASYAAFRKWTDPATCWQNPLPFRFEANGREIQFTDARDPQPRARPIFHFSKPGHLRDLLTRADAPDDTLRRRFERKEASETPWTKDLWIYDLRTNQHFTLKTNPLAKKDLEDFIKVYKPPTRARRNESDRFKKFTYDEIVARDKANLDIFWLKDESLEDTENLPPPAELAAEIVESLEAALEEFRGVEAALAPES